MNAVGTLGLRSRWETAGAWLTMKGAPVDAVGGRVTPNTAARGCSRGRGGRPRGFKHGCQGVLPWTLRGSVDLPATFQGASLDARAAQHLRPLRVNDVDR